MIQIHINTYIYVYIFVFFKRAEIESIFKEYDTNKDGVSGEKLLYLLRSLGIYLNKTESEVILEGIMWNLINLKIITICLYVILLLCIYIYILWMDGKYRIVWF